MERGETNAQRERGRRNVTTMTTTMMTMTMAMTFWKCRSHISLISTAILICAPLGEGQLRLVLPHGQGPFLCFFIKHGLGPVRFSMARGRFNGGSQVHCIVIPIRFSIWLRFRWVWVRFRLRLLLGLRLVGFRVHRVWPKYPLPIA